MYDYISKKNIKNFVTLDFETANHNRSSVCSIGMVVVENGRIVDTYYSLIKPIPNFYNSLNTSVHQLTFLDTLDAKPFSELWREISLKIGDKPIVAHNMSFDKSCLLAVLDSYSLTMPSHRFYCTYKKAKEVVPNLPSYKLTNVAAHFGYELNNHHNALADAEACAHIAMNVF